VQFIICGFDSRKLHNYELLMRIDNI